MHSQNLHTDSVSRHPTYGPLAAGVARLILSLCACTLVPTSSADAQVTVARPLAGAIDRLARYRSHPDSSWIRGRLLSATPDTLVLGVKYPAYPRAGADDGTCEDSSGLTWRCSRFAIGGRNAGTLQLASGGGEWLRGAAIRHCPPLVSSTQLAYLTPSLMYRSQFSISDADGTTLSWYPELGQRIIRRPRPASTAAWILA